MNSQYTFRRNNEPKQNPLRVQKGVVHASLTNSMETKFEASWKRWMFSKSNTLQHKIQ